MVLAEAADAWTPHRRLQTGHLSHQLTDLFGIRPPLPVGHRAEKLATLASVRVVFGSFAMAARLAGPRPSSSEAE